MKKNLFMVAAVALMAMVSCNKEEIGNNVVEGGQVSDIVFSAELEQPDGGAAVAPAAVQTKTSLGEAVDGVRPVTWNAGDKIKVNGVEFSAVAAGSSTDFTTTASFTEAETYYAVYPASAAGASDLTKVTIPASQNGTFAEAAISVAKSTTTSLSFKNVASIIKFQVYGDFKGNVKISSDQNIAGTVSVTFDEKGNPVLGEVQNPSKEITINGTFTSNGIYYVAVLPGSHKFTVKYEDFVSKVAKSSVSANRSNIVNLQKFPEPNLLYLVPNSNWKAASARFAGYFFNSGADNDWIDLSAYNGVYACEKPSAYKTVIFCRMNPSQKENIWENKWNQTGDMTIGTQPYCVIPHLLWDGSTIWSDDTTLPFIKDGNYYLVPNGDWQKDNARFAVHFCNGTSAAKWISMTAVTGAPGYYQVTKPANENHKNIIFCRMNPSTTANNWDNKWNQTGDLTFDGNVYEITGWDKEGKWHTVK